MGMIFKVFAKKLFGLKYERLSKNLIVSLIVFWGLYISNFQEKIAPFILYLMISAFTAGVMWQALSSEDNADNLKNMMMLPFINRKLIFSYIGALGIYTLITKTALLMAVLFAVSSWSNLNIAGGVLSAINSILMAACIYTLKKYRMIGFFWTGSIIALIYLAGNSTAFILLLMGNSLLSAVFLNKADAYSFYRPADTKHPVLKEWRRYSVWCYLFRYLTVHKNYLINTAAMWGVAILLPMFFRQMEHTFVLPIGFALLSLNTPICILLSCDPALEQAIRFLPGQEKVFCIPYCMFIFLCNMISDIVFLFSWEIQNGGITIILILTALYFALQSAIGSVLLEWFFPLKKWKIESDLWHHPRKYVVPTTMLLIAGVAGTLPWFSYALIVILLIECNVLLLNYRRC